MLKTLWKGLRHPGKNRQQIFAKLRSKHKYDDFLKPPSANELNLSDSHETKYVPPLNRKTITTYHNHSQRFHVQKRNFDRQYAEIYKKRLKVMKPFVVDAAKKKWGSVGIPISEKLLGLRPEEPCVIVGMIYKHMPQVPRILDLYVNERMLPPAPLQDRYVSEDDQLYLEDDAGRLKLTEKEPKWVHSLVTGTIVAVRGIANAFGEFEVHEVCFADLGPQAPLKEINEDKFVAFISGINLGDPRCNSFAFKSFIDLITGDLGSMIEHEFAASVVRVIIAGNSLFPPAHLPEGVTLKSINNSMTQKQQESMAAPLRELDDLLATLATTVDVDLVPGNTDPTNHSLPQQPLNRVLVPKAGQYVSFQSVTNPYDCEIDGRRIMGTAGQNISNITKYQNNENPLQLAESTLLWRHLAPTAPDNLPCFPFYEEDPFIIESTPHIYFIGNQKEFDTKIITGNEGQKVRIVMVPSFVETNSVVLVNLRTLNVHPISFRF